MRKRLLPISFVLSGLVVVAMGLGIQGSRSASAEDAQLEQAINATMQSAVAAYNRGDLPALTRLFTDQGFEAEFFQSKSDAASDPEFFGDPAAVTISNVMATESGATATAAFAEGLSTSYETLLFIFEDGIWKVDGSEPADAAVPDGATVIDMKLREFEFDFDASAASSGNFAFDVENVGEQEHEIVIVQLGSPLSDEALLSALEAEDDSAFVNFGFLGYLAPGDTAIATPGQTLETGNYALVCFVSDVDGLPHAFKGMLSQFSVGSPADGGSPSETPGTISPPNTGDGGLASDLGGGHWALVLGATLLLAGGGLALRGARVG